MTNDQTARSARRAATVVAVPLALLTGIIAFQVLKPSPRPLPEAMSSPRPQSTDPVEMPASALDERQAVVCRALLSQLPDSIRSLRRRPVTTGHEQNAAFGDPAVTVACGGAQPAFPPTDMVLTMNGVCWHADSATGLWATTDREVPVTVTVPAEYAAGEWVFSLSHSIASTVTSIEAPWGCEKS